MSEGSDFTGLNPGTAASQWRTILLRQWPRESGRSRQVNFVPVEVATALALLMVVDPNTQGWGTYDARAELIGDLVKRPPSSMIEKGRNLTGTRPHGARGERELFEAVVLKPTLIFHLWDITLRGARHVGIEEDRLPDILMSDGDYELLDQDELGIDLVDLLAEERGAYAAAGHDERISERAAVAMARIGQHRFALNVRQNYGHRCGFCGLNASPFPGARLLIASHVKPWRAGTTKERLDPRNGIAACPTHDAAFDAGLLTVTMDGRVHASKIARDASRADKAASAAFKDGLSLNLIAPSAVRPLPRYLEWHHHNVWKNGIGSLASTYQAP